MGSNRRSAAGPLGQVRTQAGTTEGLPSDQVLALYADRHGNVWAGTHAGIARIRDDGIDRLTPAQGFVEDRVITLYVDREGSLWVGTDYEGLLQLTHTRVATFGEERGLPMPVVYVVTRSERGGL